MRASALNYLRTALANPAAEFHPGQWECIAAVLARRRLLVVQRTGWGKSMVYFLATRLLRDQGAGVTLLISPLLSLMRNQVAAAARLGIRAITINSTNRDDWPELQEALLGDQADILLISPERLANDVFRESVLLPIAARLGLFVVDEAHCISDWGHDFRPDYRRIVRVIQALPANIPVLATTATANDRVVADVAAQLGHLHVERGPLRRESLMLQNIWLPSPAARLAWLAEQLPALPGSGIVYTLTVRDAEQVTRWLRQNGIAAEAYHSAVQDEDQGGNRREELETLLLENRVKVLVATVALGMGFDKADIGFVIHFQRPGSVVHYYQQVGRAGRSVDRAYAVLLSGAEDTEITEFFIRSAFPPLAHVEAVLAALNRADDGLSLPMLQRGLNLTMGELEKVLTLLSVETPAPVTRRDSRWHATPIVYQPDPRKVEQLCALRRAEQQVMLGYAKTGECLMMYLTRALDDPEAHPCGRCANCCGGPLLPETASAPLANAAAVFLRRSHQSLPPRRQWPTGALPSCGFSGRIGPGRTVQEGRALALWGDAGWGMLVKEARRRQERFPDDLVAGCWQLLQEWHPEPAPAWVTCVPSLAGADAVADVAGRLAARLGLPFASCIVKTTANRPQREMRNSFQQARNLDGVFAVAPEKVLPGPVLLVDDQVDSRWTFTVLGALLRQAGCPAVFPLALALHALRQD